MQQGLGLPPVYGLTPQIPTQPVVDDTSGDPPTNNGSSYLSRNHGPALERWCPYWRGSLE